MKYVLKRFVLLIFLISLILSLFSCVTVSWKDQRRYEKMKEQGYYPDAEDFPDTKWVCREVDMYFYMFDYSTWEMIGEYTVNATKYRVRMNIFYTEMNFNFYSGTKASKSTLDLPGASDYVSCEREEAGFLNTEYIYEDGIIKCTIESSDGNIWNYSGDTITFEKAGEITKSESFGWYCEELDMYIEKYGDFYYRGEIKIDNTVNYIHGYEIGNGNYYQFFIENGRINNLKVHSDYPFINFNFQHEENRIIATVTDEYISTPVAYPHWTSDKSTFIFEKIN